MRAMPGAVPPSDTRLFGRSTVASMPGWVEFMVKRRELDLSDPQNEIMKTKAVKTRAELCQMLAEGLSRSRKALEDTTEEDLTQMWRFRMNGQVVSEGPRYAMIADGAMTHLAHHRGQLTVYLRLLEAKETERRVRQILSQVPERDRRLLHSVLMEERNKDEVCAEFGITREYLRVLLHRAKLSFKSCYTRRLGASSRFVDKTHKPG